MGIYTFLCIALLFITCLILRLNCISPTNVGKGQRVRRDVDSCPDGWLQENGYCYFITNQAVSYNSAAEACRDMGSRVTLVSIHHTKLQTYLSEHILLNSWIGLRIDDQNKFTWTDGTVFNYHNWALGHPNILEINKCVQMATGDGPWTLVGCNSQNSYICHQSLEDNKCVSQPCQNGGRCVYHGETYTCDCRDGFTGDLCEIGKEICPDNWIEFNGFCYFFGPKALYGQASQICKALGPNITLISIHDQVLLNFLYRNIKQDSWIGLYGNYVDSGLLFKWNDGSPTNFKNGFNFVQSGGHKCVRINDDAGDWWISDCKSSYPFICHLPFRDNKCVSYPCQNGGSCVYHGNTYTCDCEDGRFYGDNCQYEVWPPPGVKWVEFNGSYYHFPDFSIHFFSASGICKRLGGLSADMVSIHSREEQLFITERINSRYWLGMWRLNSGESFQWKDGTELIYTNWAPNHQPRESDHCVVISTVPGYWYNANCDGKYFIICKLPKGPNECLSSPCYNGGRCIDGDGFYACQCTGGYTGENCQYRIIIASTTNMPIKVTALSDGTTKQGTTDKQETTEIVNDKLVNQDNAEDNSDKVFIMLCVLCGIGVLGIVIMIVLGIRARSRKQQTKITTKSHESSPSQAGNPTSDLDNVANRGRSDGDVVERSRVRAYAGLEHVETEYNNGVYQDL